MLETAALFQHKKANADKLKAFGFRHQNGAYVYEHPLTETQLLMTVTIDADGMVTTCIRDPESGDEYLFNYFRH